jgi:ribosomal protein S18 acetylase RimI-like enzyme
VNLTVRPASDADRAFVEDLGKRTVMQSVAAFRHAREPLVHAAFDRLMEIADERTHSTLVAEAGGERCGFLLLITDLPDEVTLMPQGFVAYMAVEPAWQRRGIGAQLLEIAEDEARRMGLPYMSMMVTEDNTAARELYERAGYFTERRLLCKAL